MNHTSHFSRKRQTGVTLDHVVCEYLDRVAQLEERTRSQVINRIVKEHARQNGQNLQASGMAL